MHRRWILLPLFTSAVSAFYPYHEENSGNNEKRFIPLDPFSKQSQDDLVTVDLKKIYIKRDNQFAVTTSNPPTAPNALAIDQDGSDYSYFSVMNFGSKGQPMYMLIDTGSANTWVMSQSCASTACNLHNLFGPDDSTTLNVTTNTWSLAYGTGTVSGVVGSDSVKFANFSMNMGFGMATNASDDFNSYPMDGIAGLGRATSNELGVPTIMQNLKSAGKLAQNVLGIHLNRGSDNSKDGEIVFGGVNSGKFTGSISYTTTSNANAWEIPVDDAFVGGTACGLSGKTAIIDTGTSYLLMPPSDAKKLHSLIPGNVNTGETFTVPCNTTTDVQVSFSGVKYSISPKDYVGRSTSGDICSSNIVGHQAFGPNEWILGDVFLKNVYSVFDFDQGRIGFALTASVAASAASSSTTSTVHASKTGSAASSTASSAEIGNPFDANSSSTKGNTATSLRSTYDSALIIVAAFLLGLLV